MDKKLTEYKLKNREIIPEKVATELVKMSKRLDDHIAKIKADVLQAKNNRENK